MPIIDASLKDLNQLLGKKLSAKELEQRLHFAKCELEASDGDQIKIEVKDSNRPDLWSAEGVARELRGKLGLRKGMPQARFKDSKHEVIAHDNVLAYRPGIACAVVKGLKVSEPLLLQLIQLQEKITHTFGRKREMVSIGLYEFEKLKPPIHYKGVAPESVKFVPLDFKREMNLREILAEHPKGKEFGNLIAGHKVWPILCDDAGKICSLVPIINSELTGRVKEGTGTLLLEMTGTDERFVNTAMNVFCMALQDRGAAIERMAVVKNKKKTWLPDYAPGKMSVALAYVNQVAGMAFTAKEVAGLLEKAQYNAKAREKTIEVEYPAYRQDLLHPIDVVEDALIAYGYDKLLPESVTLATNGELTQETRQWEAIREACIGLGLQEILTFTMTSKEKQAAKMGYADDDFVEIANYVSTNWQVFRKRLRPELLEFLSKNKDAEYPQRLFEVGRVLRLDEKSETGVREPTRLCVALADAKANYTHIKSALDALAHQLGFSYEVREERDAAFAEGRHACIRVNGQCKGVLGEVSDEVLAKFGLETKVALLELELE